MKKVFIFLSLVIFFTPLAVTYTPTFINDGVFSASVVNLDASAQEDMGRFINCQGAECNACHLVQMGNEIVDWLIGIMMVIFSIIVAYAGFSLVISGGNTSAKEDAKKKMTNAFIGIVIVLAAWILIDTLMKALVSGGEIDGRPWSQIECLGQNKAVEGSGNGGGQAQVFTEVETWEARGCNFDPGPGMGSAAGYKCPNGCVMRTGQEPRCPEGVSYEDNPIIKPLVGGGSGAPPGCDNCTNIRGSLPTNGNECAAEYDCVIRPDMLERLENTDLATNGLRVSEAWPPTGYTEQNPNGIHKSSCHGNATCVDVSFRGNNPPASDVQNFIQNSSKNNLTAVYEVPNDTRKRELEAQGVTNVITVNGINREHFSVYMCDVDSSPNACK